MNKPGWKTTEFWVSIFSVVGSATLGLKDVVSPKVSMTLISVSAAAYAIARGLSKK